MSVNSTLTLLIALTTSTSLSNPSTSFKNIMSTTQVILDINRLREEAKLRIRLICVEIRTDFEKIRPILDGKVELTRVIATQSEELHELLDLYLEMGESKRKLQNILQTKAEHAISSAVSDMLSVAVDSRN